MLLLSVSHSFESFPGLRVFCIFMIRLIALGFECNENERCGVKTRLSAHVCVFNLCKITVQECLQEAINEIEFILFGSPVSLCLQ